MKNIYRDIFFGAKREPHNLDLMICRIREGNTVTIWNLDRIDRSASHLLKLVDPFDKLGVKFKSLNDSFIDTTSPYGKLIMIIFGAIAQLERDIIIERTMAGLQSAKKRGNPVGP